MQSPARWCLLQSIVRHGTARHGTAQPHTSVPEADMCSDVSPCVQTRAWMGVCTETLALQSNLISSFLLVGPSPFAPLAFPLCRKLYRHVYTPVVYIVMACVVVAHIVMTCTVAAYVVMANVATTLYSYGLLFYGVCVMACIVMAYIVTVPRPSHPWPTAPGQTAVQTRT